MSEILNLDIYKVGTANFTCIEVGERALIFDCGYYEGNWIDRRYFKQDKKDMMSLIFNKIKKVGIIISHNDSDHNNLMIHLIDFFKKNNIEIIFIINYVENNNRKRKRNEIEQRSNINEDDFDKVYSFFGKEYSIYLLITDNNNDNSISNNDSSCVLKITRKFEKDEMKYGHSVLFTGDSSKYTFRKIEQKKILFKNKKYINECIDNLFSDVICYLSPHHGSAKNNTLKISKRLLEKTKYPVLIIISSNPGDKYKIPLKDTIDSLLEKMYLNLKDKNNFYCIPHYIDCGLKNENFSIKKVLESPSCYKNLIIPLFNTSNSTTDGYRISIDSNSLILFDSINEFKFEYKNNEDNIIQNKQPLYCMDIHTNFSDLNIALEAIMHYYSIKYFENFDTFCKENMNKINFMFENSEDLKKKLKNVDILKQFGHFELLNQKYTKILSDTENSFKNLTDYEKFFGIADTLNHSSEEIIKTLDKYYNKNNEMKIILTNLKEYIKKEKQTERKKKK